MTKKGEIITGTGRFGGNVLFNGTINFDSSSKGSS